MKFTQVEKKILFQVRWTADFIEGLERLYDIRAHDAAQTTTGGFPKKCSGCGRVYRSSEDFIARTEELPNHRQDVCYMIDNQAKILSYRNCPEPCMSTLVIANDERRDNSPVGLARRRLFHDLLVIASRSHAGLRSLARHDVILYLVRSIVWEGHRPNEAIAILHDDVAADRFRGFADAPKVELDIIKSKKSAS